MRQTRYLYRDTPTSVSPEALAETAELLRREYGDQLVIPMQPVARSEDHSTPTETIVCAVCQPPLAATSRHGTSQYTSMNTQRLQEGNPQTDRLLQTLGLRHIWTIPYGTVGAPGRQQPPPPAYPAPPSLHSYPVVTSSVHETPLSRPLIPSQLLMQSGSSQGLHRPPPPPPLPIAATAPAASSSAPVTASDPNELDI